MSCYSTLPSSSPDVLVIFALITILRNVHRPCEQYPNIVSNCLQHASSFLLSIPDFLIIFTLLTILWNVHRPCKQYLNIIDNSTSCLYFFSSFFPHFIIIFTLLTILGNVHRSCLHLLSFYNITTKEYIVQKKPCDLDHNWQSYIETFISAKNDD